MAKQSELWWRGSAQSAKHRPTWNLTRCAASLAGGKLLVGLEVDRIPAIVRGVVVSNNSKGGPPDAIDVTGFMGPSVPPNGPGATFVEIRGISVFAVETWRRLQQLRTLRIISKNCSVGLSTRAGTQRRHGKSTYASTLLKTLLYSRSIREPMSLSYHVKPMKAARSYQDCANRMWCCGVLARS